MRAIDLNFVHQQTFEAFILGKLFDVFVATGLLVQKLITACDKTQSVAASSAQHRPV